MGPIQQDRNAGAVVLAGVALAAHRPLGTVGSSVHEATAAVFEAVAGVAPSTALTPAPILTGIGVAVVDHLLAEGPCESTRHPDVR